MFGKKRRRAEERDHLAWLFTRLLMLSDSRAPTPPASPGSTATASTGSSSDPCRPGSSSPTRRSRRSWPGWTTGSPFSWATPAGAPAATSRSSISTVSCLTSHATGQRWCLPQSDSSRRYHRRTPPRLSRPARQPDCQALSDVLLAGLPAGRRPHRGALRSARTDQLPPSLPPVCRQRGRRDGAGRLPRRLEPCPGDGPPIRPRRRRAVRHGPGGRHGPCRSSGLSSFRLPWVDGEKNNHPEHPNHRHAHDTTSDKVDAGQDGTEQAWDASPSSDSWTSGIDHLAGETGDLTGHSGPYNSGDDSDNRPPYRVVAFIERWK